jgi:hypothetical protein
MSGDDKTPAWLWIIGFLALLAVLGTMDQRSGTEGDGPHDDGCSSGVSTQGCFP